MGTRLNHQLRTKPKEGNHYIKKEKFLKWRHISWATYLAIGFLFLLPFCNISCSGTKIVTFSGVQLVTGTTISIPNLGGSEANNNQHIPPNSWAIIACAASIFGFCISLIYPRPNILAGIIGIFGSFALIMIQFNINKKLVNKEHLYYL